MKQGRRKKYGSDLLLSCRTDRQTEEGARNGKQDSRGAAAALELFLSPFYSLMKSIDAIDSVPGDRFLPSLLPSFTLSLSLLLARRARRSTP